jgi:hypothetical protein
MLDPDSDLDPAIFVIDLQNAKKKLIQKFFCSLLFDGTFTSFFQCCGSRMFIPDPGFLPIPDLGYRILDPKTATVQKRGVKATNFTKFKIILFLNC